MKKMGKSNNVNANAAFKSVSKRETFDMPSKANPAPCKYFLDHICHCVKLQLKLKLRRIMIKKMGAMASWC